MLLIFRPLLTTLLWIAVANGTGISSAAAPRYEAVFVDGRRVQGNTVSAWNKPDAQPKLEKTNLTDPAQPLRWLKDYSLDDVKPAEESLGFVEMTGGDRLLGRVVGYAGRPGTWLPESEGFGHLLVESQQKLHLPGVKPSPLRVLLSFVRRVVWGPSHRQDLQPGTIFFRNGRQMKYRGLRWDQGGLRVLTAEGPQRVQLHELSEVHLPQVDPWDSYYRELALLAPEGKSRLLRMETTGGLLATASEQRFRIESKGSTLTHWYHMVQPAWCLDPLWVNYSTIRSRLYFAPHEVPLTRLYPVKSDQRSLLGGGWHWQTNRNVQGGPLHSGGQRHGWGLGVHALCELSFPLSPLVKSFRAKVGLDHVAGNGGCARARIYFDSKDKPPIFQSNHLVGSATGVDTGPLALQVPAKPQGSLILQAHPAHNGRPQGTDPLDIRDMVDWIEPMLTLDPVQLVEQIRLSKHNWMPSWEEWTIDGDADAAWTLANVWQEKDVNHPRYAIGSVLGTGTTLSRELTIPADAAWLLIGTRRLDNKTGGLIQVRLDGVPVGEFEIPIGSEGFTPPIRVPISAYAGKQVDVAIDVSSEGKPGPIFWNGIVLVKRLPTAWEIFEDQPRQIAPAPAADGIVRLTDSDPYSGAKCLTITPEKIAGVKLGLTSLPIREKPQIGEFRFLRFAIRMTDPAGLACVELGHAEALVNPFRYDAGVGPPAFELATRVWKSGAPQQWVVITRDLFADFGALDLTELTLFSLGKGATQLDHLYLARSVEDFSHIGAQGKLTPQQANTRAALAAFQPAIDKANQAMVVVNVDGKFGTGVIISADGIIATTGYVGLRPNQKAKVTLYDGRILESTTLGIDRGIDAGLLKIASEGTWPFLELATAKPSAEGRWAALAHLGPWDKPSRVGSAIVRYHNDSSKSVWVSLAYRRFHSGGPLVNRGGQLVGLQSRPFGPGGTIAVLSKALDQSRKRMAKGEVWGNWPLPVTPVPGFSISASGGTVRVVSVRAGSEAEKRGVHVGDQLQKLDTKSVASLQDVLKIVAQKLPGDPLACELTRDGKTRLETLTLNRRM